LIGVSVVNAHYRVWQLWQNVRARPLSVAAWNRVTAVLTTAEVDLFSRFSATDQQHSYRVLGLIEAAGYAEPSLLKAALLHDIGKTKFPLHVWDRVLVVAGVKLLPQSAQAWGEAEAIGWRRPFVVKVCHPQWGAKMAAAAGSDPLTVTLIQRHQDKITGNDDDKVGQLLRILQWADNQA